MFFTNVTTPFVFDQTIYSWELERIIIGIWQPRIDMDSVSLLWLKLGKFALLGVKNPLSRQQNDITYPLV